MSYLVIYITIGILLSLSEWRQDYYNLNDKKEYAKITFLWLIILIDVIITKDD